jgi:hypothetical protein
MNEPAFPAMHFDLADNEHGMTLRDYCAAKVMQTMVSHRRNQFETDNDDMTDWDEFFPIIAQESYSIADAMLKARTE